MTRLVTGRAALDMRAWDLGGMADGMLITADPTEAQVSNTTESTLYTMTGTGLTYDMGVLTGGNVSTFELERGGKLILSMTGFSLDGALLQARAEAGDSEGLVALLFTGNDNIKGSPDGDALTGLAGKDILVGGRGADTLIGGDGADQLTGGRGADTFVYTQSLLEESPAPDLILDIESHDRIDLSGIDARENRGGDQAFRLVTEFTGRSGELDLHYDAGLDRTEVRLDVDGDGAADAYFWLSGAHEDFTHFNR